MIDPLIFAFGSLCVGVTIGMVIAVATLRRRGGYQPRPLRKGETLGLPPTGGSAARRPVYETACRADPAMPMADGDYPTLADCEAKFGTSR